MLAHQHTEVMAEMEETFHDAVAAADSTSNDDAIEMRRWQQWRDTEPAGLNGNTSPTRATGSAERPIEIDGGAASAAAYAGTTMTTDGARRGEGGPAVGDTGAGGGAAARAGGGETLWGHAVHEHELSPGDQVQPRCVCARWRKCLCACARVCFCLPHAIGQQATLAAHFFFFSFGCTVVLFFVLLV